MERERLTAELARLFGFPGFRPGQEEVVGGALAGRDTLALMPTGSGKSLPYQLAAMLLPRPTVVLSPLIALMKDQVDKLPPAVAERAAVVNSSLAADEVEARLGELAAGRISLLYAAPERLRRRDFVETLAAADVGLVVVDEVHCVSMWGHDFRPDYLFIRAALAELGDPPVLGLTATATPETEAEIGRALGRSFHVVRASVVRPNLRHQVARTESEEDRKRELLVRVVRTDGPAIVYARSRESCEKLARFLRGHGVRALHYHAGMEPGERTAAQDAFLSGEARVVVATTAFGMGIDKPDIRLVALYNLPGSLEDYVQMVGRAGRDGRPSDCVLFHGSRDAAALRRFVERDSPDAEALRSLYRVLRARADGAVAIVPADELPDDHDPRVLVGMLEQAGLVRRTFDRGRAMAVELLPPPEDAPARIAGLLSRARTQGLARADRIAAFGESARCRQQEIAEHFGETTEPCAQCDACAGTAATGVAVAAEEAPDLPHDVAGAIVGAVRELAFPLGTSGLVATLAGSIAAPPSGRRSAAFGSLAAAPASRIKRWVGDLVASGHLERFTSDDGFPLLRAGRTDEPLPRLGSPGAGRAAASDGDPLFEHLRAWRLERAREQAVPPYVVFSDKTLREVAAIRPSDTHELAAVNGVGPAKIERYGEDLLQVVAAFPG